MDVFFGVFLSLKNIIYFKSCQSLFYNVLYIVYVLSILYRGSAQLWEHAEFKTGNAILPARFRACAVLASVGHGGRGGKRATLEILRAGYKRVPAPGPAGDRPLHGVPHAHRHQHQQYKHERCLGHVAERETRKVMTW